VRVKRLELTGIGPFRHQQVIDFAQLSESGLFLIDGPTGAGKTTIIDAIVFALFSGLSGESTSKERIRSDHALGNEKSEVILDFSVQGRQHRITRSPAYAAAKANGEGFTNKPAKQSLTEYHTDGSVKTTLTSATDIGVHVSRLLNMQAGLSARSNMCGRTSVSGQAPATARRFTRWPARNERRPHLPNARRGRRGERAPQALATRRA
jgi:exonuclease SbcC